MADAVANAGTRVTLAYSALPTTQALSGSGTPGTGGSSIASYAWTLLSKPAGSAAALTGAATQTPTVTGIDLPGSYLVMLVVTDNVGNVSEATQVEAPDSAFVTVCVTTEHLALVIPASGERNVASYVNTTLAAIDTLGGLTEPATTSALGVVKLAETPADSANPKVVTQDIFTLPFVVEGTIIQSPGSGNPARALVSAMVPVGIASVVLQEVDLAFKDGGTAARSAYTFEVHKQSNADWVSNTFGAALATGTMNAPASDNQPTSVSITVPDTTFAARDVVSVKVTAAPASGVDQAGAMTGYAVFRKKY